MKQRAHTEKKNAISPKTVSETPQVERAISRLQAGKLRAAAQALGDCLLLEPHLAGTAKMLGDAAENALRHLRVLGALQRDRGKAPLAAVDLPVYGYSLLEDADSHAPVVAKRILRERIREWEETAALAEALTAHVRGEALRSALQQLSSDDREQLAALQAALCRLERS